MSKKVFLPLLVALAGAAFPLFSRVAPAAPQGEDFKGAYGISSSSASASASGSSSVAGVNSVAASALGSITVVGSAAPPSTSASSEFMPASSASAGSASSAGGVATTFPSASSSASPGASAIAKLKPPPPKEEDPRTIPDGIKDTIGSSYAVEDRPSSAYRVRSGLFPLAYKERVGNEITTTAFPFYYDRRTVDPAGKSIEQQSFYTLYYRQRSAKHDVDAAFPLFFRWRDDETTTTIVPPVLWRDGPNEWHRWLAPLFFASHQPDGGYFHAPLLLTFSHHNPQRAFTMVGGLGFYDRTGTNVDWGVVPFVFGGNDKDKTTNYFLIPPLLTYHSQNRDLDKSTWLIGPFYTRRTADTSVFDVFPLFFHNQGPDYHATTILPLFHTSRNKDKKLLVTPLFLTASDKDGTTLVTPFYSQYRGRTQLDLAGPIIPLFAHYVDKDIYKEAWLIGPVYSSHDPTGYTLLTPLFGQWREYGVSNTTWVFPTFHHESRVDGWTFNIHPLLYLGTDGPDTYHDVLAPIWWDFVTPKKRTTVAFPLFWRFRDEEGITQVAANTLYIERASSKGPNYDFYFLPFVHVGEQPNGSAWDVLFGFVGYKREGSYKQLKILWIPIDLTANPNEAPPPRARPRAPSAEDNPDLKKGI